MTLTLDVPPFTVAKWNALTDDERERQRAALIRAIGTLDTTDAARLDDFEEDDFPDFEEARAAIAEALAEVEAGKDISYQTFQQNRAAFWEARRIKHHSPSQAIRNELPEATEVKVAR